MCMNETNGTNENVTNPRQTEWQDEADNLETALNMVDVEADVLLALLRSIDARGTRALSDDLKERLLLAIAVAERVKKIAGEPEGALG